ncbi:MAG: response regulator [Chloroflexota bacterium]
MTEQDIILVVDDNEMNRDMLSRRLKRQGFTVETADDGEMALNMLEQKPYALVLLDVMMPRMNGYEVLETIKTSEDKRHLPVIMISAVDDLDSVVKCIEMGAEDYLFKPFNPVLLKARVQAALKRMATTRAGLSDELRQTVASLAALTDRLDGQMADPDLLENINLEIKKLRHFVE